MRNTALAFEASESYLQKRPGSLELARRVCVDGAVGATEGPVLKHRVLLLGLEFCHFPSDYNLEI